MDYDYVVCFDRQEKKYISIHKSNMFNYNYDEITSDCVIPRLDILIGVPSLESRNEFIKNINN